MDKTQEPTKQKPNDEADDATKTQPQDSANIEQSMPSSPSPIETHPPTATPSLTLGDQTQPTPEINPAPAATFIKPIRQKTFALRYVLMLIAGVVFVSCLITILNITIQTLLDPSYQISSGAAQYYIGMMTAIIIFGVAHITLSFSTIKDLDLMPKPPKYVTVLAIIYSVGFTIAALVFLWLGATVIFNLLLGTATTENSRTITQIVVSLCSITVIAISVLGQLNLIPTLKRKIYPTVLSIAAILIFVFFLIIPVPKSRDSTYDNSLSQDLSTIENAIEKYYDNHNKLPDTLNDLKDLHLNLSLNNYQYKKNYGPNYTMCVTFKTNTENSSHSSYSSSTYSQAHFHSTGEKCINYSAS